MNLEIRHLLLVQAIVEEGSLTHAGKRLHLTQSALSRQLSEAEERLGVPLFLRVGKRLKLAPAGERMLRAAERLLPELRLIEHELRREAPSIKGVLRVATQCYTCYHWLPSLLRRYEERFPQVQVQVTVEATPQPLPALFSSELDLAILDVAPKDRRLHSQPLFQDEIVAVVSSKHPFARKEYVQAKDFEHETLLSATPLAASKLFQEVLRPAGVRPEKVLQLPLTEAIIEMACSGYGVAALAKWLATPQLAHRDLRAVRITKRGLHRTWHAVHRRHPPEFVREFVSDLTLKLNVSS